MFCWWSVFAFMLQPDYLPCWAHFIKQAWQVSWAIASVWGNRKIPWWCHQMETFSALLAICAGNSQVPGEFPLQRPVTWSFDVFFDLRLNKRLSKQSWGWCFEAQSSPLWCHSNDMMLSLQTCCLHLCPIQYKDYSAGVWIPIIQSSAYHNGDPYIDEMISSYWHGNVSPWYFAAWHLWMHSCGKHNLKIRAQ